MAFKYLAASYCLFKMGGYYCTSPSPTEKIVADSLLGKGDKIVCFFQEV